MAKLKSKAGTEGRKPIEQPEWPELPPSGKVPREVELRVVEQNIGDRTRFAARYRAILRGEQQLSCLVARRYWDQVRWAIEAYAWRFDGLDQALVAGGPG